MKNKSRKSVIFILLIILTTVLIMSATQLSVSAENHYCQITNGIVFTVKTADEDYSGADGSLSILFGDNSDGFFDKYRYCEDLKTNPGDITNCSGDVSYGTEGKDVREYAFRMGIDKLMLQYESCPDDTRHPEWFSFVGTTYYFGDTILTGDADDTITIYLGNMCNQTFTVRTGSGTLAGTNSDVRVKFKGPLGEGDWMKLDKINKDDFEKGYTETYTILTKNVGTPTGVSFKVDGSDSWEPDFFIYDGIYYDMSQFGSIENDEGEVTINLRSEAADQKYISDIHFGVRDNGTTGTDPRVWFTENAYSYIDVDLNRNAKGTSYIPVTERQTPPMRRYAELLRSTAETLPIR